MTELNLYAITVKTYKPNSNKKVSEGLENVLKRDFTTSVKELFINVYLYLSN